MTIFTTNKRKVLQCAIVSDVTFSSTFSRDLNTALEAQQLLLVVGTTRRHGLRKLAAISMHFAAEFGRVWDGVGAAFPRKTQKKPAKHLASVARWGIASHAIIE